MVKQKDNDHLGQKIRRIRALKGINQEELAFRIGKTRSLISHLERTGSVNKYTLREIAEALGVDVETIENSSYEMVFPIILNKQPKDTEKKDNYKEIIEKQITEIEYLKKTIDNQWQLINELAKKK